ncbi:MAG TPA: Na+/H+ antiporter NhaA [Gemmatimonadales bacterium]|nr:Na+/H+ antiporter NhaA [Gemmatimonadales bacterium]
MTSLSEGGGASRRRTLAGPRLAAFRVFLETESGGAVALLTATLVALAWANSPWAGSYHRLWSTPLSIALGDLRLSLDLAHWVNDGLMTLFFLVIGLEVRREFDRGELRERRRAALPLIAGLGGMVVPAVLFLWLNPSGEAARGWAMVMATDTAFALGILALAGRRCPVRLRIFLLTLVVVDDVGAISIIALAYSSSVSAPWLLLAAGTLVAMALIRRKGVESSAPYWMLGIAAWLCTLMGGVHPTVAGVAVGLSTSAYPPRRADLQRASGLARAFREQPSAALASEAARRITRSLSPNERLQHALHPWTSYLVVPLFALANAGIELSGGVLARALSSPLSIGVVVGLVLGKPIGITLGAWLATRRVFGGLPLAVSWPSLIATSSVAGVGFTVSLLIAELSYSGPMLGEAKVGILGASLGAALVGSLALRSLALIPRDWLRRIQGRVAPPIADLAVPVDEERDHVLGPPDAVLTLVQYGDYECPYCRSADGVIPVLLQRFDGQLRFVARHFPLPDVHPYAALAAEAVESAGEQGKFWEMHHLLYARQDHLQLADLLRYAGELGLDVDAFEAALTDARFAERVAADVEGAESAGVAGTPTFFINDRRYVGAYDAASMESALLDAMRELESSAPAAAITGR